MALSVPKQRGSLASLHLLVVILPMDGWANQHCRESFSSPPPIPQEPDGYENVFFARLGGSMTGKAPALTKLFI